MPKLTQKQIAKALGIEQSRTSDVLKRLGLRGCNDLAEIQAKYMQHLRHQASQQGYGTDPTTPSPGEVSLARERALLARQQREKLVLDMAIKSGKYMRTDDMAIEVEAMLSNFRSRLRQIPASAAGVIVTLPSAQAVHDFLLGAIDEQLSACADWLERLGEQADGSKRPATRRG